MQKIFPNVRGSSGHSSVVVIEQEEPNTLPSVKQEEVGQPTETAPAQPEKEWVATLAEAITQPE